MKHLLLLIVSTVFLTGNCTSPHAARVTRSGPTVILKLDDAWYEDGLLHQGWLKTFAYLNEREINATIGIVGERMQEAPPVFYEWLTTQVGLGHEVWNHGWCHCKPVIDGEEVREFSGTTYEYQLDRIQKTQALAKDKLGLKLTTFGAPYNAVDTSTARALQAVPELKNWFYAPESMETELHVLPRLAAVNIEYPVHQPDFASFLKGYEASGEQAVLVIQGHPRSWMEPDSRFEEFKKIVDFLVSERARFLTPSDYLKETARL